MVARILYHYTERDLTTPSAAQAIGNRSNFPPSFAQLTWVVNEQGAGPFAVAEKRSWRPSWRKIRSSHSVCRAAKSREIPRSTWLRLGSLVRTVINLRSAVGPPHWRHSPLKPILSAARKVAITHRSICLPPLPARSQIRLDDSTFSRTDFHRTPCFSRNPLLPFPNRTFGTSSARPLPVCDVNGR